jgi:RNA recognition motif-containing protein
MATADAAEAAVRKFNGYSLDGRTLKVEISKPSAPRSAGGGGGYRSSGAARRW